MSAGKAARKPVGWALGAVSGLAAGAVFKQVWKLVGDGREAPDAADRERDWREVLIAAALQGVIFAVVRSSVERGSVVAADRLLRSRRR